MNIEFNFDKETKGLSTYEYVEKVNEYLDKLHTKNCLHNYKRPYLKSITPKEEELIAYQEELLQEVQNLMRQNTHEQYHHNSE